MTTKIHNLDPLSESMTVKQALHSAQLADMREVLILGYAQDGTFVVRSSGMRKKDALWICSAGADHAKGIDTDG